MAVISRDDAEAADEERWVRYGSIPLIATLVLPIIIGVILVLKCVFNHCCVRKTTTKDEMYGLEGRVTMLPTADSNFAPLSSSSGVSPNNHRSVSPVLVPSDLSPTPLLVSNAIEKNGNASEVSSKVVPPSSTDPTDSSPSVYEDGGGGVRITNSERAEYRRSSSSRLTSSQDSSDLAGSLKRASAQHRQLPDLPQIPPHSAGGQNIPRRSSSVLSHDGTSELYATVGETPLPDGTSDRSSKKSSHYAQIRENALGKILKVGAGSSLQSFMNGEAAGTSSSSGAGVSRPGISNNIGGRGAGIEATPSSDSETYASSHHPYAKLKKSTEHPYARVRSGGNGNDEETDTDNYDLPQFLSRQAGPSPGVAAPSSSSAARLSGANQNSSSSGSGGVGTSVDAEGPVPPRRIGRQWRRSSHPQDNQAHFSGDSQDSRGYTSISVREPLSNIRSQVASTRNFVSDYATVSDDSEEMYAAIDDPNDSNYMRIPGEENHPRRPTWLGGPTVASPIPERREANSPLPPVPNVPPPNLSPGASPSVILPPASPNSSQQTAVVSSTPTTTSTALPVYAQVTKKSKKSKAPVTPTASNASTSSQQMREAESDLPSLPPIPPLNGPSLGTTSATTGKETSSSLHHHHLPHHPPHRSKRAASLMDNTNPMDADTVDSRRWSKADISYSEFEVVRESMFSGEDVRDNSDILPGPESPATISRQGPSPGQLALPADLVDEDNYNIIPEKTSRSGNRNTTEAATSRRRLDSGNYHEIEPPHNNTYQEIRNCKEPSDHYQEIGERHSRRRDDDDDDGGELYQVIDRKRARNFDEDDDDEDEEEEDQFYERVKPSGSQKNKLGGKKHGYEKIKRKGESSTNRPGNLSAVIPAIGSDEEDEDDEDEKPDEMYECVKYPPYERLKESKDDLADSHDEDGRNGSDFYEDIGYSRVKPKKPKATAATKDGLDEELHDADTSVRSDQVDVSQLYARVDKTKKRKGGTTLSTVVDSNADKGTPSPVEVCGNNNEPSSHSINPHQLYSKVTKTNKSNRNTEIRSSSGSGSVSVGGGVGGLVENETRLDNDNSIEYI